MCLSDISNGLNIIEKIKNFLFFVLRRNHKKIPDNDNKKYSPYYFKNCTKHITVYNNGNGIIINSATLVVTDLKKFDKIYRNLNIEDGKIDTAFPALTKMINLDKSKRFDEFGFWYDSENNIIESATEFYWSDTDKTKEDKKIKNNPKELRWTFDINKSKIEENKPYKIIYVISIKGMYPIINGEIDINLVNDPNSIDENSSEMEVIQDIENFKYIVSFEDGINLLTTPKCELFNHLDKKYIAEEQDYNTLFHKYKFEVTQPILGSKIKVYWKFKTLKGEQTYG